MPLSHIEHFLIFADDIEKSKDWYVEVLGLRVGETPDFKLPVYWMYLGERDVVHICEGGANVPEMRDQYLGNQKIDENHGSGRIDHVAFRASGLRDTIAHLEGMGVDFIQRQVDDQGLYQLFLRDPDGIKVELNFPAEEAKDLRAEIMVADLAPEG